MKYIIIPLLKFIWAVYITIWCLIIDIVTTIVFTLWEGTPSKGYFWRDGYLQTFQLWVSPYFHRTPNYYGTYDFKTYYHFIWGAKPLG